MRPVEGYVPPNIDSDNAIAGFKWRNLAEAAILVALNALLYIKILTFIPLFPRLMAGVMTSIMLGLFAAFGINEEPLSSFIISFLTHRSTRCIVKLRMPMPHIMTEKERKEAEKEQREKERKEKKEKLEEAENKAKGFFSIFAKKKQ